MTQTASLKGIRKEVLALIRESVGDAHATYYPMLFVQLLGSHAAAWLLNQILYWSERTSDPEGWFYKSYADWEREGCLSRSQVERALWGDPETQSPRITLSELGVETRVKRAPTGSPTTHYRIDRTVFLTKLSAFLQLDALAVPPERGASICEIPADGGEPIPQMEMSESSTSRSAETTTQSSDTEIRAESSSLEDDFNFYKMFEMRFGKLKEAEKPALRDEIARLGHERVGEVLERCVRRGRSWAYVLKALQNEEAEPGESSMLFLMPDEGEVDPPQEESLQRLPTSLTAVPSSRPLYEYLDACSETVSKAVYEAWSAAYHQLEYQLDRASFDTWVRGAVLVDFEPPTTTFVVAVHNRYAQEQCQGRLYRNIQRLVSDLYGEAVALRFVTAEGERDSAVA